MSLYIHLTPRPHHQEIQKLLAAALPTCKVKIPGFHPTKVAVRHDASQVIVSQYENGLEVKGKVNTAEAGVAIGIGIGVAIGIFLGAAARSIGAEIALGFLGYFLVYGIVHFNQQKKFGEMEENVAVIIKEKWEGARVVPL